METYVCSWMKPLNIVMVSMLPRLIYKLNKTAVVLNMVANSLTLFTSKAGA